MVQRRGSAKVQRQLALGGGSIPPYGPGMLPRYGKERHSRGHADASASRRSFVYGSSRVSHYRPAGQSAAFGSMRHSHAGGGRQAGSAAQRSVGWAGDSSAVNDYTTSSNLLSSMLGPADAGVRPAEVQFRPSISVDDAEQLCIASSLTSCGGSCSSYAMPGREAPQEPPGRSGSPAGGAMDSMEC